MLPNINLNVIFVISTFYYPIYDILITLYGVWQNGKYQFLLMDKIFRLKIKTLLKTCINIIQYFISMYKLLKRKITTRGLLLFGRIFGETGFIHWYEYCISSKIIFCVFGYTKILFIREL